MYFKPRGSKTGNYTHARDGEDSTLKSHHFLNRKSTFTVHSSTCQPCYFETFSSATLHLEPLSVSSCSVLRKILPVTLLGCPAVVTTSGPSSCNPGCGVVATGRSAPLRVAGPNQDAAFDRASTGVLQSQGHLQGGENFLVWRGLLLVLRDVHRDLEISRTGTTR